MFHAKLNIKINKRPRIALIVFKRENNFRIKIGNNTNPAMSDNLPVSQLAYVHFK
jgi:hypothetical protein